MAPSIHFLKKNIDIRQPRSMVSGSGSSAVTAVGGSGAVNLAIVRPVVTRPVFARPVAGTAMARGVVRGEATTLATPAAVAAVVAVVAVAAVATVPVMSDEDISRDDVDVSASTSSAPALAANAAEEFSGRERKLKLLEERKKRREEEALAAARAP